MASASRLNKPSNMRWRITVEPDGNADVVIVLRVTTDCNATGAICTSDGRTLSNSLEFSLTVPGPAQQQQNSPATGQPTISGTARVGETLTASTTAVNDEDGLDNVSYQYQWLRDDADIAGQTNSTYRLVSADQDKTIKVRVTFRDDAHNAESLTSAATTAVAARPANPLTASFGNRPATHDGQTAFTFELRFSEEFRHQLRDPAGPRLHGPRAAR